MIEIIKELNIEVSKPNVFQAVVAKQYDMNTRFIKATFVDGGDKIFIDPEATVKVIINALRPDGESQGFEGEINQDGTVKVPLHSWMLELDGTVVCDISVIDTEKDDNKKLTTTSFTLLVEKAAYGGEDITSDPQYDILVQLLETCSEAGALAEDALQKSKEANSKYDACVEATQNANQAAAGVVTIEQNKQTPLRFWVGTQAEYEALGEEEEENCFYIISDDDAYGLGGNAKDVSQTDLDELKTTGWYRTGINSPNTPLYDYGAVVHVIAADLFVEQIAYIIASNEKYNVVARRGFSVKKQTWGEWEFENPPMTEGKEYRTCEKYLGEAVYTKLITYELTSGVEDYNTETQVGQVTLFHGIINFGRLKSVSVIHEFESFRVDGTGYETMYSDVCSFSIYGLSATKEQVSMSYQYPRFTSGKLYITLKYTKSSEG